MSGASVIWSIWQLIITLQLAWTTQTMKIQRQSQVSLLDNQIASIGLNATHFLVLPPLGNLTTAIGLFIIYMEPAMMVVDVLAALINQKTIVSVFERLKAVDDKLEKENIKVDYGKVIKLSRILLGLVFFTELLLTSLNFVLFTNNIDFYAFYYYFTGIPLIINANSKIWFIILIVVVRQRFQAINKYLNETSKLFSDQKKKYEGDQPNFVPGESGNYLEKEMMFVKNKNLQNKLFNPRNVRTIKVSPYEATSKSQVRLFLLQLI